MVKIIRCVWYQSVTRSGDGQHVAVNSWYLQFPSMCHLSLAKSIVACPSAFQLFGPILPHEGLHSRPSAFLQPSTGCAVFLYNVPFACM